MTRWLAATLVVGTLLACRREPAETQGVTASPVRSPLPPSIPIKQPLPPLSLPTPPTAVAAPVAVTPESAWTQLPEELTRSAAKDVLHRGDRLIVGRDDGLWELTWWGKPKKHLTEHPVRALRFWDERTVVYLDTENTLRKLDLAVRRERPVASLPSQGRCQGRKWQLSTFDSADLSVDREADRVCVRLRVAADCAETAERPDLPEVGFAVGLISRAVQRLCTTACIDTGTAEQAPAIDAPDESTAGHLPLPPPTEPTFSFDPQQKQVLRRQRDGADRRVITIDAGSSGQACSLSLGSASPSGRWALLACVRSAAEKCGDTVHYALLDTRRGTLHPLAPGPWRTLAAAAVVPATALFDSEFVVRAVDPPAFWLPHSDVLAVAGVIVIPALGAFRSGLVAR